MVRRTLTPEMLTLVAERLRALAEPGQRRGEHLVAFGGEQVGDAAVAPAAVPGAVNEDEGVGHVENSGDAAKVRKFVASRV